MRSWFISRVRTMLVIAPSTRYVETSSLLVAAPLIYWAALLLWPRTAGLPSITAARP